MGAANLVQSDIRNFRDCSSHLVKNTLEVAPSRVYARFPDIPTFLNASWKSCSVRVFNHHLSCVKMAAFLFYLQSGKQRTVGWWNVFLGQKFPDENKV
jgi:hypothetical protein